MRKVGDLLRCQGCAQSAQRGDRCVTSCSPRATRVQLPAAASCSTSESRSSRAIAASAGGPMVARSPSAALPPGASRRTADRQATRLRRPRRPRRPRSRAPPMRTGRRGQDCPFGLYARCRRHQPSRTATYWFTSRPRRRHRYARAGWMRPVGPRDHARDRVVRRDRRLAPPDEPAQQPLRHAAQAHWPSPFRWRRSAPIARNVSPRTVPARRPITRAASSADRPATKPKDDRLLLIGVEARDGPSQLPDLLAAQSDGLDLLIVRQVADRIQLLSRALASDVVNHGVAGDPKTHAANGLRPGSVAGKAGDDPLEDELGQSPRRPRGCELARRCSDRWV